jgi:hypothetical protein
LEDEQEPQESEIAEPDEEFMPEEETPAKPDAAKAALVINVYSWMTPVFGILMLAAGLLLGYFGRPLLSGENQAVTPQITAAPDVSNDTGQEQPGSSPASPEEMMAFLTSQVRHFKGAETAPVTIIEFSDFQ